MGRLTKHNLSRFAFNGSFNVHLFIGSIKDDQTERFVTKKNEVGFSGIFATSQEAPCSNCIQQREDGIIYEDAIPITPSLFAHLKSNDAPEPDGPLMDLRTLESFEPEQVRPFLKANLAWRLTDTASNLLDDQQRLIDSALEITVSARKFDLPTPEHPLGVYHPAESYRDITEDKLGGFGYTPPAPAS
jgi:Tyosinase C-terminal domain